MNETHWQTSLRMIILVADITMDDIVSGINPQLVTTMVDDALTMRLRVTSLSR